MSDIFKFEWGKFKFGLNADGGCCLVFVLALICVCIQSVVRLCR